MTRYDDIIDIEHFEPRYHPRMSMYNRAAQFSPFAALTGYEGQIHEKARKTSSKIIMDENKKEMLDWQLQIILQNISYHPEVTITYFVPDFKKEGGKYVEEDISIKKIDSIKQCIISIDNHIIPIDNIVKITSEQLQFFDE